jgi:hypothetical protein
MPGIDEKLRGGSCGGCVIYENIVKGPGTGLLPSRFNPYNRDFSFEEGLEFARSHVEKNSQNSVDSALQEHLQAFALSIGASVSVIDQKIVSNSVGRILCSTLERRIEWVCNIRYDAGQCERFLVP